MVNNKVRLSLPRFLCPSPRRGSYLNMWQRYPRVIKVDFREGCPPGKKNDPSYLRCYWSSLLTWTLPGRGGQMESPLSREIVLLPFFFHTSEAPLEEPPALLTSSVTQHPVWVLFNLFHPAFPFSSLMIIVEMVNPFCLRLLVQGGILLLKLKPSF